MKNLWSNALRSLALPALLGACAPPLASPAQGVAWAKLTTPHFALYTDVPPEDARGALDELEAHYGALEDAAFPYERKPAARVEVTLFREKAALDRFAGGTGAFVFRDARDPEVGSMLVYHQRLRSKQARQDRDGSAVDPAVRALLHHHLARRFAAFYFPAAPRWLSAGLATFYETLDVDPGRLTLGMPPKFDFEGGRSR